MLISFLKVAFVLGVVALAGLLLQRLQARQKSTATTEQQALKVTAFTRLGTRTHVFIVRYAQQEWLIGVGEKGQPVLLSQLPLAIIEEEARSTEV